MGQQRAVEGGDQRHRHAGAQGLHVRRAQVFQHLDQTDQGTDHTEGRGSVGASFVHGHYGLVTLGSLLDVVFQDAADPVGVVGVHNEHDGLLKEGVLLLVGLFLQRQQTIFSGNLCQLGQFVHIHGGIEGVGAQHDAEVLRKGFDLLGIAHKPPPRPRCRR